MRLLLIAPVLAGFIVQQFSCCGEHCSACAETESAEQHHEHDGDDHKHGSPSSSHGPHHLCVATHLFYVGQAPSVPVTPDFSSWQVVIAPQLTGIGDATGMNVVFSSLSLPPPTALRSRAVLHVWVI